MSRQLIEFLELLKRREVLMADVLTTESMRGVAPCVVAHHPQLPTTPPEEIRQARLDRRPVVHVRIEQTEAGLVALVEKEQPSHISWSREADAPLTHVSVVNLDNGGRKVVMLPAKFGASCGMTPEAEL